MSDKKKKQFKRGRQGWDNEKDQKSEGQKIDENSPVIKLFRQCQSELDSRYDKHERIVKLSRDITIESKRIIFFLHRKDVNSDTDDTLKQAEEKLRELEQTKFKTVARELVGEDPYQFLRGYSAGLQEYIEAVSFYVYLKENKLINLAEVEERLTFQEQVDQQNANLDKTVASDSETSESPKGEKETSESAMGENSDQIANRTIRVNVPIIEFMLGIADLTGELMRLAINSVGSGDLSQPFKVCRVLQELGKACDALGYVGREWKRKVFTLKQSLRKVENACYTLQVRGSETPAHLLVDALSKSSAAPYTEEAVIEDDD